MNIVMLLKGLMVVYGTTMVSGIVLLVIGLFVDDIKLMVLGLAVLVVARSNEEEIDRRIRKIEGES